VPLHRQHPARADQADDSGNIRRGVRWSVVSTGRYRRWGMYRFLLRPKWIAFHVLVAAGIVSMLLLAHWQWTKYNARNDFVDLVHQRQRTDDAQPLAPLLTGEVPADIEFRIVTATGQFLPEQLIEINRTQGADVGVNVLTPFQIDGGPLVLVNRGFMPDGADVPAPPTGPIIVGGTARLTEVRKTGELTDNASGARNEVRRVDLPLIEDRLAVDLAPVFIELRATDPATPEPPVPVPKPDLSGGPPHLSYTIQWLIFSLAVGTGWVLAVRRSKRTRDRATARAERKTVSATPAPPSA
jgi:cytochrome oxidase assembly protein ShyY1